MSLSRWTGLVIGSFAVSALLLNNVSYLSQQFPLFSTLTPVAAAQNSTDVRYKAAVNSSWGNGYKLTLTATPVRSVEGWQTEFTLPKDHTLRNIYNASASGRTGRFVISGGEVPANTVQEAVLIVDGPTNHEAITNFYADIFAEPVFVEPTVENVNPEQVTPSPLSVTQDITDTWNGGYRLVLEVTANADVPDWRVQVRVPEGYRVSELYGFEADRDTDLITLSRASWNPDLARGQSAAGVFIVQGSPARQLLEVRPPAEETASEVATEEPATQTPAVEEPTANPVLPDPESTLVPETSLEEEPSTPSEELAESTEPKAPTPELAPVPVSDTLTIAQQIPEAWNTGYKINLEATSTQELTGWSAQLQVPAGYAISEIYGLTADARTGVVTVRGESWNATVRPGQSAQGVLIMQGSPALRLPRVSAASSVSAEPEPTSPNPEEELAPTPEAPSQTLPETTPEPTAPEQSPTDSVTTEAGTVQIVNPQVDGFRYGEVLQKNFLLYQANRGGRLKDDHRITWRGDATVNDGRDVNRDLSGGYYDAGDHIIFTQPFAFSLTMLAWGGAEYKEAYREAGQLDELLDTIEWGTDWFLRAHEVDESGETERLWVQVSNGEDHRYWVPPEMIDDYTARPSYSVDKNKPGTEIAAGTASAFAATSILYRGIDDDYADLLLERARSLYAFANTYRAKYTDSVPEASPFYTSWSGYYDELALGGVWMYRATGEEQYLRNAEQVYKDHIGYGGDWTYAPDEHKYAALALLAKESPDPWFAERFDEWLSLWVNGESGITYTPGGFAHRTYWSSAPLTLATAYLAEWYHDKVEPNARYSEFAKNQLDYLLGNNPRNYSYVVGYGNNYPVRPHHRGSAYPQPVDNGSAPNTHTLWGALVGGLVEADDYAHFDIRSDYIANEVGISYNAPLASAAIQQYDNHGGAPLSDEELDNLSGIAVENPVSGGPVTDSVLTPKDTDGDGLLDSDEQELGTDSSQADTDGDGASDGVEVANNVDPLNPSSTVDASRRWLESADVARLFVRCQATYPNSTTTCDFDIPNSVLLSPEASVAIGDGVFSPGKCRVRDQALVQRVRCQDVNTGSEPGARRIFLSLPVSPRFVTLGGFSLATQIQTLPTGETTNVIPLEMDLQDTDQDGVPDFWENQYASAPQENDASGDMDGDGLSNVEEYNLGTSPQNPDSDEDGVGDAAEIDALYTDPTSNNSDSAATPDIDESADETLDGQGDFDNDRVSNEDEVSEAASPLDQVARTDIPARESTVVEAEVFEDAESASLHPLHLLLLASVVPVAVVGVIYLTRSKSAAEKNR